MFEVEEYKQNVELFRRMIKGQKILSILFEPGLNPTFDVTLVPFRFDYAHSVIVEAELGSFIVSTSMNSEGFETFWISEKAGASLSEFQTISIDSVAAEVEVYIEHEYAYGFCFHVGLKRMYLYAGEIYDRADGTLDYKIQDEMILVFQDEQDATAFTHLAGCC